MKNLFENKGERHPEPDSGGHLEELRLGRFSPFPEEIEKVREKAKAQGEDPDLAEQQFRAELDEATERLRTSQREEALQFLEESGKRKSKK